MNDRSKESIIKVSYLGPQSSHHLVNKSGLDSPHSHWTSQGKDFGNYAVHVSHLVRMQLRRLSQCALGGGFPPGHLFVHSKVKWSYHLSLTHVVGYNQVLAHIWLIT